MAATTTFVASGRTDGRDWLIEADEPLAGLQLRGGGELPGLVAAPALLELVRKSRRYGLRLARVIEARDAGENITAWVEIEPDKAGEGCRIGVTDWKTTPISLEDPAAAEQRRRTIERHLAELTARLGPDQTVIAVECDNPELADIAERLREGKGRHWTELIDLAGDARSHSRDWWVLDGSLISVPASLRTWKAVLLPLGRPEASAGFELLFVAEQPPLPGAPADTSAKSLLGAAIGREIAPVLAQPMSRIIANAETIRAQLAGPLSEDYSNYAGDIAAAGEHLLALIGDLADLEAVEAEDFETQRERIDLGGVARRAAEILSARAQEREISIEAPQADVEVLAVGEFRRVLQILLNLLGNALRYGPPRSHVSLRVERIGGRARVTVADQGEGLTAEQQGKVFDKFERLGRGDDGGSGLGLYISRWLARAMNGELSVKSAPGLGAQFTLDLPAFEDDSG